MTIEFEWRLRAAQAELRRCTAALAAGAHLLAEQDALHVHTQLILAGANIGDALDEIRHARADDLACRARAEGSASA